MEKGYKTVKIYLKPEEVYEWQETARKAGYQNIGRFLRYLFLQGKQIEAERQARLEKISADLKQLQPRPLELKKLKLDLSQESQDHA